MNVYACTLFKYTAGIHYTFTLKEKIVQFVCLQKLYDFEQFGGVGYLITYVKKYLSVILYFCFL